MEVEEETKLLDARENTKGGTIQQAPFVTDTNAWTKLGLKVALKEAVAQGAERIAWTTGEQQNERYDLSKEIDNIYVQKGVEEGDTIVKKKGELIFYIHKKDTIIAHEWVSYDGDGKHTYVK